MILFIQLPQVAQTVIAVIVIILLALAAITYIIPLMKGQLSPRPLTWIGWTILMGISLYSQVVVRGWEWNEAGITLSILGCFTISILSLKKRSHIVEDPKEAKKKKLIDWTCVTLAVVCVGIYTTTKDPWLTTIFAIIADFLVGIPTQRNAYKDPESEKSIAWPLGVAAFVLTIINCIGFDLIYYAFPIYLFFVNLSLTILTNRKVRKI